MKQVKMLKDAMKNNYIVPAFNFANFEILRGLIDACVETKSPIILQASENALNYFGDELMFGIVQGVRKSKLPISMHLDHGKNLDVVKRAIKLGFDSVMIDGSTLPFKENVKLTKKVVAYAHKNNVAVQYWTINDAETMRKLIEMGCDCIMTDDPVLLKEVLNEYKK